MTTTNAPLTTTQSTAPADEQDHASARQAAATGSVATPLLPWVPGPRQVPADGEAAPLTAYLGDAAALITARVTDLADTAIRLRPPWTSALGQQPADPDRAREWRRHVGVIAAYRDQHKITTDDPRQVLGPYAETGRAGHRAYWHAAESVLAARRLAGLEPANGASADDRARAQIAADIYRSLPDHERADIAAAVAAAPGTVWLGDPTEPDEHAATQPGYAPQLIATAHQRAGTSRQPVTLPRDPSRFPTASPGKPNSRGAGARGRAGPSARTVPVRNPQHDPTAGRSSRFRPGTFRRPAAGLRSVSAPAALCPARRDRQACHLSSPSQRASRMARWLAAAPSNSVARPPRPAMG